MADRRLFYAQRCFQTARGVSESDADPMAAAHWEFEQYIAHEDLQPLILALASLEERFFKGGHGHG